MKLICLLLWALLVPIPGMSTPTILKIAVQEGFSELPPLMELKELFSRAVSPNIEFKFLPMPAGRSSQLASTGQIDGELIRSEETKAQFPNLIMSSKPIGYARYLVLFAKSKPSFESKDLQNYKGLAILNSLTTQTKSQKMKLHIEQVPTVEQGLNMVISGRADYIILAEPIIYALRPKLENYFSQLQIASQPFQKIPLYFLMNKKHADLMPEIEKNLYRAIKTNRKKYKNIENFLNSDL